jgi:hypothetical protein
MIFSEPFQKFLLENIETIKLECEAVTQNILKGDIWIENPSFWEHTHIHWTELKAIFYRMNLVIKANKEMPSCPLLEVQYHLCHHITSERVGIHIFEYHWTAEKLIMIDDFFIIHKRA